jgi:hypothetical protein
MIKILGIGRKLCALSFMESFFGRTLCNLAASAAAAITRGNGQIKKPTL